MSEQDFKNFYTANTEPDSDLDHKVHGLIKHQIKKDERTIFTKVAVIHLLAGIVTLSFCPQFGWNPLNASPHFPHLFMKYGMWVCGLFCGTLFMSIGSVLTLVLIKPDQLSVYVNKLIRNSIILGSVFLFFFMMMSNAGVEKEMYLTASFILFWLVGAVLTMNFFIGGFHQLKTNQL